MAAQRQAPTFDLALGLASTDNAEDAAIIRGQVDEALGCLSPMERMVLSYKYIDGMSISAIATLLHVSGGRISQVASAARQRLQEAFELEAG